MGKYRFNPNHQDSITSANEFPEIEHQHVEEVMETTVEEAKEPKIEDTNYLNIDKQPEEELVANGKVFKHGTVTNCNTLNFREKPDKTSNIIHTFNAGENILYSETDSQEWFEVKDKDGKIGYCMSEYIKIEV